MRATAKRSRSACAARSSATSQPHDAQRAVLERLAAGKNTLAVLGTGRGKSFCFQYAAALRAFGGSGQDAGRLSAARAGQRSIRSAARARSIRSACAASARTARSITRNAKSSSRRCATGRGISCSRRRSFSSFIATRSRGASAPAFAVVDEAHHLHESRHRPAYARLSATIAGARQSAGARAHCDRRRRGVSPDRRGAAHRRLGDRSDGARESARRRRARDARQDRLPRSTSLSTGSAGRRASSIATRAPRRRAWRGDCAASSATR